MTIKIKEISIDNIEIREDNNIYGLGFWYSPLGLEWVCNYLNAKPFALEIYTEETRVWFYALLRHLPGGYFLLSGYPYTNLQGDKNLFWDNIRSRKLLSYLQKKRIVKLELAVSGNDLQSLEQHTDIKKLYTPSLEEVRHILDLSPAHNNLAWLDKHFGRKIRWAVNRARRDGGCIRIAKPEELEQVQSFYVKTMQAKGAPVNYGAERFAGIMTTLANKGMGQVYVACLNNKPVAMAAVVDSSVSRHFVQLAVPPEVQNFRLSELLVATAIEDAAKKGMHYFDFMVSQKGDLGLISFKAKWGSIAEPVKYLSLPVNPVLSKCIAAGRWLNKKKGEYYAA